jgi:hypothetical protein
MQSVIGTIVLSIVILFVVFLILRELICWYYKINEGIELLRQQLEVLESINVHLKKNDRGNLKDEEKAMLYNSANQPAGG